MSWLYLYMAGFMEIIGVVLLKRTVGTRKYRVVHGAILVVVLATSLYFLTLASRTIPVGTAYAIWTGIGSVGSVLAGMALYRETYDSRKFLYLSAILIGVVGLRLTS